MTGKKFREYFPLITYYRDMPNEIIGAYDFLRQRHCEQQVKYVKGILRQVVVKGKNGRDLQPHPTRTSDRRHLIVGLVFKKGLLDDFLKECWTEKHAPFAYRKKRMGKWYGDYKYGYESRYGSFLEKT